MDILEFEDLYQSYLHCRKRKVNTPSYIEFEKNEVLNLANLIHEINTRTYKISPSRVFVISEPQLREIFAADFRDRVVQHFVYDEIFGVVEKILIYDSSSCRPNKGTSFAINRVYSFIQNESDNFKNSAYALKIDLSGFFCAIPRERARDKLLEIVNAKYQGKHKELLNYLIPIIAMDNPTEHYIPSGDVTKLQILPDRKTLFKSKPNYGLAVGNITSQMMANVDLSELDHFCKHNLHVRHYHRYVDDIVIISKDKKFLEKILPKIIEKIEHLGYRVSKNKTYIIDVGKHGMRFLGKLVYFGYTYFQSRAVSKMYFDFRHYKNNKFSKRSMSGRMGTLIRNKGLKLFERLIAEVKFIGKINNY